MLFLSVSLPSVNASRDSSLEDDFTQVAHIQDGYCQTGHSCSSKACKERGMKVSVNLSFSLAPHSQEKNIFT